MKRLLICCSVALSLVAVGAGAAQAEVKTRNKSQVKFEGMLGRMMGMFGGKAVKEGVVATSAVKGDRMVTLNDTTGRIVDLAEEKVYELDLKKKSYTVMTFAELRQQLKEAQEKAQRDAEKAAKEEAGKEKEKAKEPDQKAPEMDVEFDVKETGERKAIAGYDAREVVMTITVHEKGRTIEDRGGLIVASDMWLGPEIPAMRELAEFELRDLEGDRAGGAGDVPRTACDRRGDVPARQASHGPLEPRAGQHEGDAALDGDDLRRGEKRRSDGQGKPVVQRRRAQRRDERHARPQDDEKGQGRKAPGHDLHYQCRNARDRHIGQRG